MNRLPNPIDSHVGSRVRVRRTLLGLSQEQLAERLGIAFQQIQAYEKGTKRINASRLHELARVLEVPITFFFEDPPEALLPESDGRQLTLIEFFTQQDGVELAQAFVRIRNPRLRRLLIDLALTLADETAQAAADADTQ